jgi:hypothetical protein
MEMRTGGSTCARKQSCQDGSPGVLSEAGIAELKTASSPEGARYMDVPSNLLGDATF